MAGLTLGGAAAAAYPAPFIQGGSANVAIVYGSDAMYSDIVQAGNIQSNLQSKMGTSVGSSSSVSGEAKSLASGSDLLYLLDDLAENVGTITKNDLPTVLADGSFVDNDGTTWEFEQTLIVGTDPANRLSFGNSDNDFDDPELMLELSTSTGTPMYTWTLNFDKATPLNATASEGEEFTIFGKTYTIGTATDANTLVLLGGSDSTKISVGGTASMTVEGVSYSVTLDGLSSALTTVASITVNGETKTFTEGQTKTYVIDGAEVDVYAKTVFRTGDDSGHAEIELGSDKLTLEDGNAVQVGSDNTDIDGTLVTIASSTNMHIITKIEIDVAATDNDVNHVLVGESFTDPVFGTVKLELNGIGNGPIFEAESDISTVRPSIELSTGGSRELEVTLTDSAGITKTVPFAYNDQLQDDAGNPFVTVEGNNLTDDDYFFLNSGDYQHLMRVTKVNNALTTTSDIEIEDQFTGTKYLLENKDFNAGENVTINSQTYVITNNTAGDGASGGFKIESADAYAGTHRDIFPYLELVAGEDFPRVTFINQTNLINNADGDTITTADNNTLVKGRTYNLPTGTIQFGFADPCIENGVSCEINDSWLQYQTVVAGTLGSWTNMSGDGVAAGTNTTTLAVGEGYYTFIMTTANADTGAVLTLDSVKIDLGFDVVDVVDVALSPVIMFVEDKDKSDADARNVIVFNTTDDGSTYSELNGEVLFSGDAQYDSETWDTTEYKGYLTNYGTYVLRDRTDTNQHLAKLTYGTAQMYADVFFAGVSAVITAGTTGGATQLGDVLVKDSEVSSVATKNLIVVGGSCINAAAATLIGEPACGARFTELTNVGTGEYLLKGYASSSITSELALLVAGYDAADTVNGVTYVKTKGFDTSSAYIGTSGTTATAITTEI